MNIIIGSHGVITIKFKKLSSRDAARLVTGIVRLTAETSRAGKTSVEIASLAMTPEGEQHGNIQKNDEQERDHDSEAPAP